MDDPDTFEQFSYDQALKRVTDLNKFSFNYRFLFASIVAGYYTAINFIVGGVGEPSVLSSLDFYIVSLLAVTVAAFCGIVVISFFDFIFQELIENALRSVTAIESRYPNENAGFAFISNKGGKTVSLRISVVMTLFYSIPAWCLLGVVILLCAFCFSEAGDPTFDYFSKAICSNFKKGGVASDLSSWGVSQGGQIICSGESYSYTVSSWVRNLASFSLIVTIVLSIYFTYFSVWRIYIRFALMCQSYFEMEEKRIAQAKKDEDGGGNTEAVGEPVEAGRRSCSKSRPCLGWCLAGLWVRIAQLLAEGYRKVVIFLGPAKVRNDDRLLPGRILHLLLGCYVRGFRGRDKFTQNINIFFRWLGGVLFVFVFLGLLFILFASVSVESIFNVLMYKAIG
ncbi:hypothetical protein K3725_11985 [Leisingera sp. S132]|uniref:hypothetical protein n=1 Tax=Leisingera sp. S132 TaxID=2867016 RepID=UPI0021A6490F|nr:hypothetical protein [Leisingera sp. S132]UWQ78033.1 hypothetical protein K3725_11985 [Leisingera sp. S132]